LRRLRATAQARVQLAAAFESFERLGAGPWAKRAGIELRAAGQARLGPGESGSDLLTPQEQQIAELAAAGLTNKQIAERLFLSHRTVGGHLHQVFPKLGITTRAALRDALAASAGAGQALAFAARSEDGLAPRRPRSGERRADRPDWP
jgi:DNA-binding NarL/FixJ family response regulator